MSDTADGLSAYLELLDAPEATLESTTQSGRGPQGNLRNFASMGEAKFLKVAAEIRAEDNDTEALDAIRFEAARRGL